MNDGKWADRVDPSLSRTLFLIGADISTKEVARASIEELPGDWIFWAEGGNAVAERIFRSGTRGIAIYDSPCIDDATVRFIKNTSAKHPNVPLLLISSTEDPAAIVSCLIAGLRGFLKKPPAVRELALAISSVVRGWPALSTAAQSAVLDWLLRSSSRRQGLSPRQLQIIGSLALDRTDKEIASHLNISRETVHVHLQRLYKKLGAHSRSEALECCLDAQVEPTGEQEGM